MSEPVRHGGQREREREGESESERQTEIKGGGIYIYIYIYIERERERERERVREREREGGRDLDRALVEGAALQSEPRQLMIQGVRVHGVPTRANLEQTSQTRPYSGLVLSHFRCESFANH